MRLFFYFYRIIIDNFKKLKYPSDNKVLAKHPPSSSRNLLTDILNFLIHKPQLSTHVKLDSYEQREEYTQRVLQRIGIEVSGYSVLNFNKIGIDAPVRAIFEELLDWNGDSTCWPNHIARVYRINDQLEDIKILLFGKKKLPFGWFSPLFRLNAIRIQRTPASVDLDNARYLLYKCSGGYPIGIFVMYVRSSIPEQNETAQSQLFFAVGFDFYGKKKTSKFNLVNFIWEKIHNRVTANTLNRMKQLSEWRFEKMQSGIK